MMGIVANFLLVFVGANICKWFCEAFILLILRKLFHWSGIGGLIAKFLNLKQIWYHIETETTLAVWTRSLASKVFVINFKLTGFSNILFYSLFCELFWIWWFPAYMHNNFSDTKAKQKKNVTPYIQTY